MLDREQVHKVALLARLQLTPAEEEQYATQLSSILEYFEQLNELNTAEVPPTTRAIDASNITRPDALQPWPAREEILNCAPERNEDFFRVPKIMESAD